MLRGMDSAVAGLTAHQNKLDIIGNNLANVNTAGFKSQTYTFQEAMYQTSTASTKATVTGTQTMGGMNAAQYGYGAMMGSIATDMSETTPSYVGGFNAHIAGMGFFITLPSLNPSVEVDQMKTQNFEYTRVGQFKFNSEGYMVDALGNFVYGFQSTDNGVNFDVDNLVPLRVPSNVTQDPTDPDKLVVEYNGASLLTTSNTINSAGEIMVVLQSDDPDIDGKSISIGKVGIATFQNPEGLMKAGGYYYHANEGDNTGAADARVCGGSTPTLMTGYLEGSNVNMAQEFVNLITTQRGFQANSKIITVSDEMLAELVNMKR